MKKDRRTSTQHALYAPPSNHWDALINIVKFRNLLVVFGIFALIRCETKDIPAIVKSFENLATSNIFLAISLVSNFFLVIIVWVMYRLTRSNVIKNG
jgi:hypothetical protein